LAASALASAGVGAAAITQPATRQRGSGTGSKLERGREGEHNPPASPEGSWEGRKRNPRLGGGVETQETAARARGRGGLVETRKRVRSELRRWTVVPNRLVGYSARSGLFYDFV
jgi:hypothetical protein